MISSFSIVPISLHKFVSPEMFTAGWRSRCSGLALALALTTGATTTQAQEANADSNSGIIVVTAQKRNEDVKNVPLSVSVLSGKELENRKLVNFEDMARITPGVAIYNTGGSNLSRIVIRGVSSTNGTATVGVYLDDISLTVPNLFFTGATLPSFIDIDHVESLRGPQGTLFGASALGGAIRFIANKPRIGELSGSFLGDVSGTKHAGLNYKVQGVLNLPISDKAAWRVAVHNGKQSGFVDRIDGSGIIHKGVDEERSTAIRTSLLFEPNETISIEPSLLWQKTDADGTNIFQLTLPNYQQRKVSPEPNSDELVVPSLTVKAGVGSLGLTSVTSYLRRTNKRQFDGQVYNGTTIAEIIDPSFGANYDILASLPAPYTNNVYVTQWTQELRLATESIDESGNPYELQAGVYFSDQKVRTDDREYVTSLNSTVQSLYGMSAQSFLGAPVVNDLVGSYTYTTKRKEFALFAEGSYELLEGLKATVGVRKSFSKYDFAMDESGWSAIGAPPSIRAHGKDNPFTPKFALTYEASKEATLYANVSKGYRLGGNNNPLPTSCGASLASFGLNPTGTYTPDSLWSYEGGMKLRLFGNRLTANASGYRIDWKDIQQSVRLPSCGYVTTVNAGSARIDGGELEITARITQSLSLGMTGSLVDAKIKDAAAGAGTAPGQRLLHVPRSSFTAFADYSAPITANVRVFGHVDANFQGSSRGSFAVTNPDYSRPSYTIVNANLGVETGAFTFTVYMLNLLNEDKVIQRPSVVAVRQGLIPRPRTYGISGKYSF